MSDWQWWQDKLAGKPVEMSEGTPHAGFYRWPRKIEYGGKRSFIPVAYWPAGNGELNCRVADDDISPLGGRDIWVNVGAHPVTEEAYRAVAERGEPWPDEHPAVPMQGGNQPPDDDSFEGLKASIEDLAREAEERLKGPPIANQAEADQIANLADRLAELWKKADSKREEERRPHNEALKSLQQLWLPVLTLAEVYKTLKYKLVTPWLQREETRQRQEAEAAAAGGEPAAADTPRPRAGSRGRAQTLKSTKKAQIDDYPAALKFFEESDDIRACVQMLANRAVRAGITVPGCTVVEDTRAV
jgi:hypothetical protein